MKFKSSHTRVAMLFTFTLLLLTLLISPQLSSNMRGALIGSDSSRTSLSAATETFCCSKSDPNKCQTAVGDADCAPGGFVTDFLCSGLSCEIKLASSTPAPDPVYCCVNNGIREVCAATQDITQCAGGYADTDPTCANMGCAQSSASDDGSGECEMRLVDGLLQQCCKQHKYSPYYYCQHISEDFNRLCTEAGFRDCKRIGVTCKTGPGHSLNTAIVDGKLCFLDPTGGRIVTCDTGTKEAYDRAVCLANGKSYPCDCTVTNDNDVSIPEDPAYCAFKEIKKGTYDVAGCKLCCDSYVYTLPPCNGQTPPPLCKNAVDDCNAICTQMIDDSRQCENPNNCRAGYIPDTCNPDTCQQEYNTGLCNGPGATNPGGCSIILRTCLQSGVACKSPDDPDRNINGGGSWGSTPTQAESLPKIGGME